jgi:hypothetical protein
MPIYGYRPPAACDAPAWTADSGTKASCLVTQEGTEIQHPATTPTGNVIATDFIPAVVGTDVVDGVIFEVFDAFNPDGMSDPPDRIVTLKAKLTKDGVTPVGAFRTATDVGVGANHVLGSSTDMWGTTLTPAELNAATFGLIFFYESSDPVAEPIAVDRVRAKYFTSSLGGGGAFTGLASKFRRIPGLGHKEREAASRKS